MSLMPSCSVPVTAPVRGAVTFPLGREPERECVNLEIQGL
jgi:hypothetical protein